MAPHSPLCPQAASLTGLQVSLEASPHCRAAARGHLVLVPPVCHPRAKVALLVARAPTPQVQGH